MASPTPPETPGQATHQPPLNPTTPPSPPSRDAESGPRSPRSDIASDGSSLIDDPPRSSFRGRSPSRSWSGSSGSGSNRSRSHSLSHLIGYNTPPPPPPLSNYRNRPSRPSPPAPNNSALPLLSPFPQDYDSKPLLTNPTAGEPPPPLFPLSHPIIWRPPTSILTLFGSASLSSHPEAPSAPDPTREERRRFLDDATAKIMLHVLDNNHSNGRSDYAYVLSLFPLLPDMDPGPTYSYPENLSSTPVFIDRIGWMEADEACRYLMMGYRVWDSRGRRLHFAGLPWGYDSIKEPIRYLAKEICTQDERQVPDLHWQIRKGDLMRLPDDERFENLMPWDIHLGKPEFVFEGKSALQQVQLAWIQSRFENARTCYWKRDCFEYVKFGRKKMGISPLVEISYDERPEWIIGPYLQIGVDVQCLMRRYPATTVRLKRIDGDANAGERLCDICSTLNFKDLFEWGLRDVEVDFGTTDQLMAKRDCNFCNLLTTLCSDGLDRLRREDRKQDPTPDDDGEEHRFTIDEPFRASFIRNPVHCLSTKPFLVINQNWRREYLGPIVSLRTVRGDIRGNFELEDKRFVDYELLKRMINTCAAKHIECRRENGPREVDSEMILIDVQQMCLVQLKSAAQYITLSYVWGNKPMFKTTTDNFQALKIPGSLLDIASSRLTHDVATVVKGLGVPYLWVDALCIIQDDESHKTHQIQRMASIYGQSCLTIVALTGTDSNSPLPGVSAPRPQTIEIVQGMPFSFQLSGLVKTAHNVIYETRGWTFQERLISRRCLFFCERQAFLECRAGCESDHEQIFPEQDRGRYENALNPLKKAFQPSSSLDTFSLDYLETFCKIVSQYTSRQLSFQSDIENAFLGIQDFMTKKLGWSFIAGLPIGVFDWALLWLPRGQLKRRVWKSREDGSVEISPPSWSWLGWEGRSSYACYTYLHKPFFLRIRPQIKEFMMRFGSGRSIGIRREASGIWHDDVSADIKNHSRKNPLDDKRNISFSHMPILSFHAQSISAFPSRKNRHHRRGHSIFSLGIEWLNTGTDYRMLRHGLRHNYNEAVESLARTYQHKKQDVDLVAIAVVDVQQTFRGGQFGVDKLFESRDQMVVMLIVWRDGKDRRCAERVAIGYLSAGAWDKMGTMGKEIKLG